MNIIYLMGVLSTLLFYSPMRQGNNKMLVATFNLYMDGDKENTALEVKFDRWVFQNDCEAFIYLSQYASDICSPEEIKQIEDRHTPISTDTLKTKKF